MKAFSEALKEMDFLTGFHFGCVVPCVLTSLKDSAKVLNRMEYLRVTVTEQRLATSKYYCDVIYGDLSERREA